MKSSPELLLLIKSLKEGEIENEQFFKQLTELVSATIDCSRASLWLYSNNKLDEIVAIDLYDRDQKAHFSGLSLLESDFPPYFNAMREDGGIDAPDARNHPSTACFNAPYFQPNGIVSLLDVGVTLNNQLVGVFCCENVGDILYWNEEQIAFLEQTGRLISFAIKPLLVKKFAALFA